MFILNTLLKSSLLHVNKSSECWPFIRHISKYNWTEVVEQDFNFFLTIYKI